MTRCALMLAGLALAAGCSSQPDAAKGAPAVYFQMFYGGSYDMGPFNAAWNAARENPSLGVAYTFPIISSGLEAGTTVRLYGGRYTGLHTGDDVISGDELELTSSRIDANGNAEFPMLSVSTNSWQSGTNALPQSLLCGETQLVVRAYRETNEKLPAAQFLAAAWFVAVTQPCQ